METVWDSYGIHTDVFPPMPLTLSSLRQVLDLDYDDIIDVRAPAEWAEDRLPGAISLPVLDDEERARVGTIYKQDSPFRARKIGAALVAKNAAKHLEGPLADKPGGWRPLVYCWRGGQRSGSFASILSQIGWRVETVAGGYKTYRTLVVRALYDDPLPSRVIVLDGNTGTAKTELLGLMAGLGVQVIDLEGMANHRGSLFGARAGGSRRRRPSRGGWRWRSRGSTRRVRWWWRPRAARSAPCRFRRASGGRWSPRRAWPWRRRWTSARPI